MWAKWENVGLYLLKENIMWPTFEDVTHLVNKYHEVTTFKLLDGRRVMENLHLKGSLV